MNWSATRPRLYRDIHTVGGIYVTLLLALQAISGALIADLFPVQMLLGRWLGSAENAATTVASMPAVQPPRIGANTARDIALGVHPSSTVVLVVFPNSLSNFYSVRLYPTDQPKTRYTRQVLIDPATGSIVRTFDPAQQSPARRFFGAWMIWMHNGQFFGLSGRVLLVATGLVLALLFPSGLYIWLRRRPARLRGRVHEPRHRSS
ncbi:MAG: PepSY-associated TM helix domain-containing protein [Steroidobacteraceae bacterium]